MIGFKEAFEALKNGFYIRRESWPKNYYMLMENGRVISYVMNGMTAMATERRTKEERLFSFKDIDATDWIVYETNGDVRLSQKFDMKPLSDFDRECLMTIDDFAEDVKFGSITDYDGCGKWATKDMVTTGYSDNVVSMVNIAKAKKDGFTHVCWYNK